MSVTFTSSEREPTIDALQGRVAELMGVINAAQGQLVDLVADALDQGLWEQHGVLSPGHWLAWQCGMGRSRARQLLQLVRRRGELPATVAALRDGELSVDQAAVVARHAPAELDESVVELAKEATVAQLQRTLPRYAFDRAGQPAGTPRTPLSRRPVGPGRSSPAYGASGRPEPQVRGVPSRRGLPCRRGHAVPEAPVAGDVVADTGRSPPRTSVGPLRQVARRTARRRQSTLPAHVGARAGSRVAAGAGSHVSVCVRPGVGAGAPSRV